MLKIITNRILAKNFFIKKDNRLYCSKCGKMQLQDDYNRKKHAEVCKFNKYDFIKDFSYKKDYVYAFKISKDKSKLYFIAYEPDIILIPGFKDKYKGAKWAEVFRATFLGDGRIEEKGLLNIDIWFRHMIDTLKIPSLNIETPEGIIKDFFSDILYIDSLGAFLDIYRSKGFHSLEFSKENINSITSRTLSIDKADAIYGEIVNIEETSYMHIEIHINEHIYKLIISDKFVYSDINRNIFEKLLFNNTLKNEIPIEVIKEFDDKYPLFGLYMFLNNKGKNIFIPLLGINFNKNIELLYKAKFIKLAENFSEINKYNHLDTYKSNLQNIFGVSLKTLKLLNEFYNIHSFEIRNYMNNGLFDRIKEIYQYNPKFLDVPMITTNLIKYFFSQNITKKTKFKAFIWGYDYLDTYTDDEVLKTIKYILNTKDFDWNLYLDYIKISLEFGSFLDGKWPKDLRSAHNKAVFNWQYKQNKTLIDNFLEALKDDTYKSLSTEKNEEFKDDKYVIILPKNPVDLIDESHQMNNCVKTYIKYVANKSTWILFLREKSNINKSLVTIEVFVNKHINQVKAFANSKPNEEISNFIKKWAKIKELYLSTNDII